MKADSQRRIRKRRTRKQAHSRKKILQADVREGMARRVPLGLNAPRVSALRRRAKQIRDADTRRRFLTLIHWCRGWPAFHIASMVGCGRATVYDVVARFGERGIAGLVDGREDNGNRKIDRGYLCKLRDAVMKTPQDYGWTRPRWTQELLIRTLFSKTGTGVCRASMSRALRAIGGRRGRPRPIVLCRWTEEQRKRRMADIHRLIDTLPPNEVVVYEDEVDIDLNPKIGYDWMLRGQQKQVVTPGNNEKRYIAGAQNAQTGELTWVSSDRKNSALFIDMIDALGDRHSTAKIIHVILDNGPSHTSGQTEEVIRQYGGRIKLHFLPSYYPDGNSIERLWLDLHEQVTRNHRCGSMDELMGKVFGYLRRKNYQAQKRIFGPRWSAA